MKKIVISFAMLLLFTPVFCEEITHNISIDTMPTLRFLMRGGLGIGLSYELTMANYLGFDFSLAYGQVGEVLQVITPRLQLEFYFDGSAPIGSYVAIIFEDDIAGTFRYGFDNVIGIGAGFGVKYCMERSKGLFIQPHCAYIVLFSSTAPTTSEFQLGWVF